MHNLKIYTERILIILIITAVAILIPTFVDFLNISGSLGAASLGFILPPIYYFQAKGGLRNINWGMIAFNIFLIAFGFFGGAYSIYTSIKSIIDG